MRNRVRTTPGRYPSARTARHALVATAAAAALAFAPIACNSAHNDAEGSGGTPAPDGWSGTELPIVEVQARLPGRSLAILMSGDGNWADVDRQVAETLADSGVAVVGLRSRSYLRGHHRTPDALAADVTRLLRHYMAAWQRDSVVLVGYSRGADFVPFVANRLPAELRARIALMAMLAPAPGASFEFHWLDMVRDNPRSTELPVLPELERADGVPVLCIYGREEHTSACRDSTALARMDAVVVERDGGHHFDGDYTALGRIIVAELRKR